MLCKNHIIITELRVRSTTLKTFISETLKKKVRELIKMVVKFIHVNT